MNHNPTTPDPLAEELRSVFAQHADGLDDTDALGRAGLVIDRGLRVHRRRRIAGVAVAGVAVVAAGFGIGPLLADDSARQVAVPASASPRPLPSASAPTSHASTSSDVHGERVGTRLYLVTPDGRFVVPEVAGATNVDVFATVAAPDGWVVAVGTDSSTGGGPDSASQVLHVTRQGTFQQWALGNLGDLVASPDGASVAWLQEAPDLLHRPSITTRSLATGAVRRYVLPVTGDGSMFLDLVGWQGNSIVFDQPGTTGSGRVRSSLDLATGQVSRDATSSPSATATASAPGASSSSVPATPAADVSTPATPGTATGAVRNGTVVLVTPTRTVVLPDPPTSRNAAVTDVVAVPGGWFVRTMSQDFTGGGPDAASQVVYVPTTGDPRRVALDSIGDLVASPRGTRVAWVVQEGALNTSPSITVVSNTGDPVRTLHLALTGAVGDALRVTGWDDQGIRAKAPSSESSTSYDLLLIDPVSGTITRTGTTK